MFTKLTAMEKVEDLIHFKRRGLRKGVSRNSTKAGRGQWEVRVKGISSISAMAPKGAKVREKCSV